MNHIRQTNKPPKIIEKRQIFPLLSTYCETTTYWALTIVFDSIWYGAPKLYIHSLFWYKHEPKWISILLNEGIFERKIPIAATNYAVQCKLHLMNVKRMGKNDLWLSIFLWLVRTMTTAINFVW